MSSLKLKEANGIQHACCPTCGRMYAAEENGAQVDIPAKCKRCGGPMDYDKAIGYGEEMAAKEHRPELTAIGNRMRSQAQPEADKMIRSAANK